jgi:HSP20 family molecular chaperone IbpA
MYNNNIDLRTYEELVNYSKFEMEMVPSEIRDLFSSFEQSYAYRKSGTEEIIPGCAYFVTGSSRWEVNDSDSDIDIVIVGSERYRLYDFLRDHPDRCTANSFSTEYSVKLELPSGKKVDVIWCPDAQRFMQWLYATWKIDVDIKEYGYVIDEFDISIKSQRVTLFERYKCQMTKDSLTSFGKVIDTYGPGWKECTKEYLEMQIDVTSEPKPIKLESGKKHIVKVIGDNNAIDLLNTIEYDIKKWHDSIKLIFEKESFGKTKSLKIKWDPVLGPIYKEMQKAQIKIKDVAQMFEEDKPGYLKHYINMDEYKHIVTSDRSCPVCDAIENKQQKKEDIMSDTVKVEVVEKLEEAKIIVPVPGISVKEVDITVDNEDNVVYINIKNPEDLDKDVTDLYELEDNVSVKLNKKYQVDLAKINLENGLLTIIVPVNAGRVKKLKIG